jgi:hypothetical protein
MNIEEEYQDICNYLKNEYEIDTWIDKYLYSDYIYFKQNNDIYSIGINDPHEGTFAPNDYLIDFSRENKKDWSGSGYMRIYKSKDKKEIDDFLKAYGFEIVKFKQETLF